jgi:peptidyl-prolyl cis-trans isomerase B (cyclophilin B)
VPSNEQRREAAKRKLERQLARRAERARRRRTIGVLVTVVAVVVVVGGIYLLVTSGHGSGNTSAAATPSASSSAPTTTAAPGVSTKGPCKYTTTPSEPAPNGKNVGVPADPSPTPKTGTVTVTLKTSQGDIPLTLNRAAAPCTVQSFLHLVQTKFYDNTPCHRMTDYPTPPLDVLQCGDPTGTGSGGPGYTIPDEKPTTLKPAPTTTPDTSGAPPSVVYPAGTIAMANTGQANSGGSQFFLVFKDSYLPADYTVFGNMTPDGLTTVNKIAAGGITPGTDPSSGQTTPNDGQPKLKVTINQAVSG